MYLDFFGLKEKPFALAPNPKFLYLTPGHREALAQLIYGVREGVGFMLLTGDVGTGKTTLVHALRQRLEATTTVGLVFHSTLGFDGLLEYLLEDLGIPETGKSRAQRLIAMNKFLIERRRVGETVLLILDEAHHLDARTLEELRLLSNFETPAGKLLQILLVGQPELDVKLSLPELRQLKQRIAILASIRRLGANQIERYIHVRLRAAGAKDLRLFSDQAVRRIGEYTGGVPRLVNMICDHCLLIGYADRRRRIDRGVVEEAIRYLEGAKAQGGWRGAMQRGRLKWALGAVAAALIGTIAVLAVGSQPVAQVGEVAAAHLVDLARAAQELLGK